MMLDYELVRMNNCAELQQIGFMLRPGTRVYHICHDVIPIAQYKKELELRESNPLFNFNYDRTNQTNPFRFHQVDSSEAADS